MSDIRIRFRDRPLQPGEQYQTYCDECGEEVHPDFIHSHKCPIFCNTNWMRKKYFPWRYFPWRK